MADTSQDPQQQIEQASAGAGTISSTSNSATLPLTSGATTSSTEPAIEFDQAINVRGSTIFQVQLLTREQTVEHDTDSTFGDDKYHSPTIAPMVMCFHANIAL